MAAKATRAKRNKRPIGPRFADLAGTHDDLDALFKEHRHALMALDLEAALERLDEFWRILRAHIRVEDEILLPAYTQRVGHVEGGAPELFLNEHRLMERRMQDFRRDLRRLCAAGKRARRADVLALLDREASFQSLMEHHDERERAFLYPLLDRATTKEERALAFESIRRIEIRREPGTARSRARGAKP